MAAGYRPDLLLTVATRRKNKRTVEEGLVDNNWIADVGGEISQLLQLWIKIGEVQRDPQQEDSFRWPWTASGLYSASSTYSMLCHGQERFALAEAIWRCKAPLKNKIFMWLAASEF